MAQIETVLTQHGGAFGGAAGPVRSVSSRTNDLLPYVARVAEILHPELDLTNRVGRLVIRLELGIPGDAVELAAFARSQLGRGDYQQLLATGLCEIENIEKCDDASLLHCVGNDKGKLRSLRDAVKSWRESAETVEIQSPLLPSYIE